MASRMAESACAFSNNGKLLCVSGSDGKLKVWDTTSGLCRQEYTKNLHLSSPCTTLTWLQTSKPKTGTPKRRRTSSAADIDTHDVVAAGTALGTILLYNVGQNSLIAELNGHSGPVTCLSATNERLFSGSDDKHIIEWNFKEHKIKSKWKAGKERVKSILVLSCGQKLLSASSKIKLWDINTKMLLKTFTGHATDVFSILQVPEKDGYFVSAAKGDRNISVWNLSDAEDLASPLASFVLRDSALTMHLTTVNGLSRLCAISESGVLHIFEHRLNGSTSKPLKPKMQVTIATEVETKDKSVPVPLPIRSVFTQSSKNLLLTYGDSSSLLFETFIPDEYSEQEHVVLIRQIKRKIANDEFNSRTKVAVVDDDVEYVSKSVKGKLKQVPLERRLDNLTLAAPENATSKKDHLVHLLIQGLQSRDRDIIQDVLFRADDTVIYNTVKHLPVQALAPLIRELTHLFQGKTFTSRIAVKWLQSIVKLHSSLLLSNPELASLAKPIVDTIESKVSGLVGLLRLKGRLGLVLGQMESYSDVNEEEEEEVPLISYQEPEDREEEDEEGREEESGAEEWEEFSELEESGSEDQENEHDEEMDDD